MANPDLADAIHSAVRTLQLAGGCEPVSGAAVAGAGGFGRLRILGPLGSGGMATVHRARDPLLNRDVALKLLPASVAKTAGALERFRREARALARIQHPHIVAVHDVGETDGAPWFTMELIDGESLQENLARREGCDPAAQTVADLASSRMPTSPVAMGSPAAGSYVEAVARMVVKLADALEHAHRAGLVHRDVKPANIMVDRAGEPHLVDFGLVRGDDAATVTRAGIGPGTPAYMAPEQISGHRPVGPRTDVYGLGVTLYEMLTLRRPFGGETTERVFSAVLNGDVEPPRRWNPRIPRDLETVCLTAIDRDPARRYASAAAFAEDLRSLLNLEPIRARPPRMLARLGRRIRRHPVWTAVLMVVSVTIAAISTAAVRLQAETLAKAREDVALARRALVDGDSVSAQRLVDRAFARDPGNVEARELGVAVRVARTRAREEAEAALAAYQRSVSVLVGARKRAARLAERVLFMIEPLPGPMDWPREDERVRELSGDADEHLLAASVALSLADRHKPDPTWVRESWLELHMARWRAASGDDNNPEADAYRKKVEEYDVDGRHRAELEGRGTVALAGSPAGAVVHLFRYQLLSRSGKDKEHRLVPVPLRAADHREGSASERATVAPGDVVVVVNAVSPGSAADAAGLRPGDLITRIDGAGVSSAVFVLYVDPAGVAARNGVRRFDRLTTLGGRAVQDAYHAETAHAHPGERRDEAVFARGEQQLKVPTRRGRPIGADLGLRLGTAAEALAAGTIESPLSLEVTSEGETRRRQLEPADRSGIDAVLTACPLLVSTHSAIGTLPLTEVSILPGSYLVVVRSPGHEDLRLPMVVARGERVTARADLLRAGTTPPGFVYVSPGPAILGGDPGASMATPRRVVDVPGFFIARAEVTVAEYAEFLDDPDTILAIAKAGEAVLVPREADGFLRWARKADGRIDPEEDPRCPVHDITGADARAFVEWRNQRARERHEPWTYGLPSAEQWEKAARGADGRWYPWGSAFSWSFCRGGPSRWPDVAVSEPVLRFTADESPYGVRDLAGGVIEWLAFSSSDSPQLWRGGGWQAGDPRIFRAATSSEGDVSRPGRNDGFRLVARPASVPDSGDGRSSGR